jgi:hypothetical protein
VHVRLRPQSLRLACVALLGSLAWGLAQPAAARPPSSPDPRFLLFESPHFDVYYQEAEHEAALQVASLAERWHARLAALFGRGLDNRHTLVLFGSAARFRAAGIAGGMLSPGSAGATLGARRLIALPFGPSLADTAHIVGHELVHAFQYEAAERARPSFPTLPPWFLEGMAECLALGPDDPGVLGWLRDAARQKRVPGLSDLDDPARLPYRSGHGAWRFLTKAYGNDVARRLLAEPGEGLEAKVRGVTGLSLRELSERWKEALREEGAAGRSANDGSSARRGRVVAREGVAPSLSPDGRFIAWASPGEPSSLWLADSGVVRRQLLDPASNPRYDSLHVADSSGAWDPSGRRLAYAASNGGSALVVIVDAATGRREREIRLGTPGDVSAPAWSPDGERLAFSGQDRGRTDLFVYELRSGELSRLTDDGYADLQPAWSPDGGTIVFATDRFTTDLDGLLPGPYRLAAIDASGGAPRELPGTPGGRNFSPRFGRTSDEILFVGDPDRHSSVYRVSLSTRVVERLTAPGTEVAGLMPSSPALATSRRGDLGYSVFRDGRWQVVLTRIPSTPASTSPAALVR